MATKKDVQRLLKKKLTGKEAARLILEDSWEVDHQREGFLSDSDIQRIKGSLYGRGAQEYAQWIEAYRLVDYSLKEAHIKSLEVIEWILLASKQAEVYWLEGQIRDLMIWGLPAIVTQKQYDELRAKQREQALQQLWTLRSALDEVAQDWASEAVQAEWQAGWDDEEGVYEFLLDYLAEEKPELYGQAIQQGIQLIREGKLGPLQLQEEAIRQLQALAAEEEKERARESRKPEEMVKVWSDFGKRGAQIVEASYRKAREGQNQDVLLSLLEQLRDGSLTEEEEERLLDYTYCTVRELYEIGLARWKVDEYKPGWDEETGARPAGMVVANKVAIIQDPYPHDLDERGYYKDLGMKMLSRLSGYVQREQEDFSSAEFLETAHERIKEGIKTFLAIQVVVEAISEVIGVQMTEDLEEWYDHIERSVNIYNLYAAGEGLSIDTAHILGMPKLKRLRIGRLKPTARSLEYYRERMAMALGYGWWGLAIESLDFQEPEAESLAEELRQDIEQFRGSNSQKEARDGQE